MVFQFQITHESVSHFPYTKSLTAIEKIYQNGNFIN